MLKKVSVIFFILFLILPIVQSATIVQVNEPQEKQTKTFWQNFKDVFKSKTFWFVFVGFILIVIFLIFVFIIIRWLIQYIKSRTDLFYQLKIKRLKLAKVHKSYPSKKYFKFHNNTPIRLVRKNIDGKATISRPIAYHKGDYITHEGNVIISFNMIGNNRFFFFPMSELLIIPNYDKVSYMEKKGEKNKEIVIDNIPLAKDIVQFNENEILLYADSISNTGQFYVPVLRTKEGKIIDLSFPIYQKLKDVVIGDYLYEQTEEFSKVAKKSIDINPNLRYQTKFNDSSQSVDTQGRTNTP